MTVKTIKVDYLARVEGESALQGRGARWRRWKGPSSTSSSRRRFFEALLRGRDFSEAPDITSRICGICPVAYQMSACARDRAGARRQRDRPAARPAPAALLRGVDREPRAPRLHAARPGFPRLRGRRRDGARPRRRGPPRASAQEGRQRDHGPARRARDPPDQRPRGRLLPRPLAQGARPPGRAAEMGARGGARDRPLGRGLRVPATPSPTSSWSPCPIPTNTR